MGQKVNPIAYRISAGYAKYSSCWFAPRKKNYVIFVNEDYKIREGINKKFSHTAISKILINRRLTVINVVIHSARVNALVGKNGEGINQIKTMLSTITSDQIDIKIVSVENSALCASLVAKNIAHQLENKMYYRRVMRKSMSETMRVSKGFKVICSGRLGGAEIARTECLRDGAVPLHNLRAIIDYGFCEAFTTYGVIGVKVWIFKGEVIGAHEEPEAAPVKAATK